VTGLVKPNGGGGFTVSPPIKKREVIMEIGRKGVDNVKTSREGGVGVGKILWIHPL
jgi:hypothetical protein